MSNSWNDTRPMAPHLQVWKWHPTMLSSILHRASAIACYVALGLLAIGLLVVAITGRLPLSGLVFGPLGAIGLFVFAFAFSFMALAQLRHAIWNRGVMFEPHVNNWLTYAMIALAVVMAVVTLVLAMGVVS